MAEFTTVKLRTPNSSPVTSWRAPLVIFGLVYLEWLGDEDTLKERHHHGDQPAYGLLFPVGEPVHHGKVCCHSTSCRYQEPAHNHKPPGQASLAALPVVFLLWGAGALYDMVFSRAHGGEPTLQQVLHVLHLPYRLAVTSWIREARRVQDLQLLLHVT